MSDNIFGTTSTPSLISVAEAALEVMTEAAVLSITDVDKWTTEIYKGIDAGWKSVGKSALGGDENVAILIKVTVEPEKDWPNKILQNARFGMIRIATNGTMEMFASDRRVKNMRKTKIKSAKDVVNKINTWLKSVSEEVEIKEALNPLGGKPFEDLKGVADVALKIMTGQTQEVKEEEKAVESEEKPQELTEEIV
jgi:hypothetical protein